MKSLIRELHEQFCKDLNELWLEATFANDGVAFDKSRFTKIIAKIEEAKKDGYTFYHVYQPQFILNKKMEDKELDRILCRYPEWENIRTINRMIELSEQNKWNQMLPHFEDYRKRKMTELLQKYAMSYAKENGPFYTGINTESIYAFGCTGSVAHDMILLTFVYNESNHNNAVSNNAGQ